MVFEHFALNVENPIEAANWYVKNCEMKIVRGSDKPPYAHFIADKTGRLAIEIYKNDSAAIIDLNSKHPLEFHFAFMVKNAEETKQKLLANGATFFEELHLEDGSHLVMLRDPFGVPLQLCQRGVPMMDIEL
ncbi:MAG: VOC family protein [Ignavibacteriae bacterium]|nr:VOC family protein [Ignavibacteriota bacterium]MCB9211039.1 VOC family protein [Ignavibacteriales bacterium]MCB9219488.1 VOC family protein [Ignavibacteriales bacterium]MCB9259838.1 VOC family protein [Ignavibacteriales bacterium]